MTPALKLSNQLDYILENIGEGKIYSTEEAKYAIYTAFKEALFEVLKE